MDDTHSHGGGPLFAILGFTFGIFYKIWENPYTQDFMHGLISGAGGALAALAMRWCYKKFVQKDQPKQKQKRRSR